MIRDVVRTCVPAAVAASIIVVATASAQQRRAAGADLSEYLPPGEGRTLVAKNCTTCHDLKGTLQIRKDKDGWEAIILDMGARGAPLMIDDVDPIVNYLSSVFGPKAPPFTDVARATKDELMKIPGVTAEAADRLVAERTKAPLASQEQVRTALGLDAPAFDKIKPYLFVGPSAGGSR